MAVTITLRSGTKLVDTLDRIDVVGKADNVAVAELVEVVRRRRWDAVELYGSLEFRRATAFRLQMLEPPIAVADSPLTEADQAEIVRLKAVPMTLLATDGVASHQYRPLAEVRLRCR